MKKKSIFLLLFLFITNSFIYSQEQDNQPDEKKINPILSKKFHFTVGAFFPSKSVKIGADGSTPNDEINFDDSFKFNDNQITPIFDFNWFFTKKWMLSVEYFGIRNATKATLEEDINIGDITFNAGSYVKGGFSLDTYRVFVGRVFVENEKHQFGGGLGLHVMDIGPFIAGEVIINENETKFESVRLKATAPLPNIGLWYHFVPSYRWTLSANVDWFGIELGEYGGGLWDVFGSVKYQLFDHVGLVASYRYFQVDAKVKKDLWNGHFELGFVGPSIGITGNF